MKRIDSPFKFIIFKNKKNLEKIPTLPGVYCFKKRKKIFYIGKAQNLRERVKNHLYGKNWWERFIFKKKFKGEIGFAETSSEIEALILESRLIKKHQPSFNILWKDDKNYFYVAIKQNKEKIPYLCVTHQIKEKDEDPAVLYLGPFIEGSALKKVLKFLRRIFPYYHSPAHLKNKCPWCYLNLCPGPFATLNLKNYQKNIRHIISILKGKKDTVLKQLKKEMENLAKKQKFEEAARIRDKIFSLEQIMAHAHIINTFLPSQKLPLSQRNQWQEGILLLQSLLQTSKSISKIEAYDISNLQGKFATGSLVVFENGLPNKNMYRKFKIKTQNQHDIAMLKEVLKRRFSHQEWAYPQVILIDGGISHFNAALEIKNSFSSTKDIKVISLAKKGQKIFIEGYKKPFSFKELPSRLYHFIIRLDKAAHFFALNYHKKLRKKDLLNNKKPSRQIKN